MTRPTRILLATLALVGTAVVLQPTRRSAAADPPTVGNTELSFGDVEVGVAEPRSVTVYNYDAAPQLITSTAGTPSDSRFTVVDGCDGVNLAASPNPGYYCEIVYTLTPDALGTFVASAELTVNGSSYTVSMGGHGIDPPGTVTGTVTYGVGGPVDTPRIKFTSLDGDVHHSAAGAADGTYSASVPPGTYCVSFGTGSWDGTTVSYPGKRHCLDGITPVVVAPGGTTANIDAVLHLGSISGTARDHNGVLMPSETVRADVVGGRWGPYANTDAGGAYTIANVPAGTWCVGLWSDLTNDPATPPCPVGHRLVTVAADQAVTGVDLTAAAPTENPDGPTGAVSGKVTDAADNPLADRSVNLDPVDEFNWSGYATTAADGTYTTSFVPPGEYCAYVDDDGSAWAGEHYADKNSCDGADLVTVGESVVTGIDFALAPGGTISGVVTDPGGSPVTSGGVTAVKLGGYNAVPADLGPGGAYTIEGLSAGQYCVRAYATFSDYPATVYGGGPSCERGATPVTVALGAATNGIDIQLLQGGSIEGTVTVPTGYELEPLMISGRDEDGEFYGYVYPDLAGRYELTGLAPGTYCLTVRDPSPTYLVRQTFGSSDPVYCRPPYSITVADGAPTVYDITIARGGTISGWVIDPNGYPDPDPNPRLDPDAGENDRVRPDGSYSQGGVPAGSYCVSIDGFGLWVLDQTYDGVLDCTDGATLVTVVAGETTGNINFFKRTGGSINGTISRPAGGPGEFTVEFHRLDAPQVVLSDVSNTTGETTSEYSAELPPGTYCVLARPHSSTGLANRAFGGTHSCAGATPVVVVDTTPASDIDIALTPQIYYALDNPARLIDTRPGRPVIEGAPAGTGPIAANTVLEVQVGGLAGVPADAASAALNVTVAGAEGPGHLTLFPCGEPVPTASNVNYVTGQTVPNAAITKLGTDGKVCIFTFATTDIIVDVAGYFPSADGLIPLTNPARLIDTRPGRPVVEGAPAGTGPVAAKSVLEVQVGGLAGVPGDAASAVLNVTAVAAHENGHLTVYPCGQETPTASNVNYVTNQTAPNSVIARLGTDGKVCIHTFSATDIVVDVAGYLPNAEGLVPLVTPARLMDTRPDRPTIDGAAAGEGPIAGQTVRELQVGGRAGLPSGAASVVLNVTAAGAMANGHLTLFPCGEPAPTASNVNYLAGQTIPNAVIAKLGAGGRVCIRAHATTDVVVDVAGFLPAGDGPFIDPQVLF